MDVNPPACRSIIHLDMDAFYASVEMLDNPALRGRPVIVGGNSHRGVVSAASYEARAYGIHSAMPMAMAAARCPDGIFLPVRMARYQQVSAAIFAIYHRFTPLVEPLSLDEAFLDVTGSARLFGKPAAIADRIRRLVRQEICLTVSAGVAASKLIAKIASDQNKPDGLTLVPDGEEKSFISPLPISRLWGVGRATRKSLAMLGVHTIGDLRRLPEAMLVRRFGRHGRSLYLSAHGIDERDVEVGREIQSVGHEETFSRDLLDRGIIHRELLRLAVKVGRRLRRYGVAGRTVTLKVKFHDFIQISRSQTVNAAIDDSREIYRIALELLQKTDVNIKPVRLLGISLSLLRSGTQRQGDLFQDKTGFRRQQRINRAMDAINDRYGSTAILPGGLLHKGKFLNSGGIE